MVIPHHTHTDQCIACISPKTQAFMISVIENVDVWIHGDRSFEGDPIHYLCTDHREFAYNFLIKFKAASLTESWTEVNPTNETMADIIIINNAKKGMK